MRKKFIGVYNPSIILTYIGVFSALMGLGILQSAQGKDLIQTMDLVMILLIISGVCDMFDGAVARMIKRTQQEKDFGIQLDSLADTVSFVVYPAAILLFVTNFHPVCIAVACFYVFAGIMRLGWFNITTEENKGLYKGLPVTTASIIFPAVYTILRFWNVEYLQYVLPEVCAIVGLLFIVNFRLKKLSLKALLPFLVLAVIGVIGLILF